MIPAHLTSPRYKITCKCLRCDKVYSKIVARLTDKDPPCPRKACREAAAAEERARMESNIRAIIESECAPGITGSNLAKGIDLTAEIVQKDYGLTDLKDNVRAGESSVPKLPPKQQEAANNFFSAAPKQPRGNPALANAMSLIGRRALAGSFKPEGPTIVDYTLSADRGPSLRPPIKIVAG
jgi:hypothetical protein